MPPPGLELRGGHSRHAQPSRTGRASFGVPSRPQYNVVVVVIVVFEDVDVFVVDVVVWHSPVGGFASGTHTSGLSAHTGQSSRQPFSV